MPYCPECSAYVPDQVETCPTCGASLVSTPGERSQPQAPPLMDTQRVADDLRASLGAAYQYLRLIGVGGMGAVFLLREVALKRLVAAKVMAPSLAADAAARARFMREARAAAALAHPNVVRVYAVGETAELKLPYIVMQYVEGPSLAEWIQRHPRATEREARRIIGEVAAGLAAAHARNLLHRDVKPGNVLLEAESGRAYVADFGVSAALGGGAAAATTGSLTATGHVVGTPIYMSPEQAAGDVLGPKSDVYSLGVLAYELLAGELPFKASTALGWAAAHLRDTPTPVGTRRVDLAPEVARLVDRCVAKDPADRPSADDVARGMLPTLASEIEWPPPGLHWLHGRSRVLSRLALVAFAGAILTLTALAFTPTILRAHSNWLWRFQIARAAPGQDPASVTQFLWQTELVLGVSVLAISLCAFLALGGGALWRLVRLRASGWHWGTLVDVAADHDGRSGLVLSGAREFASLEQPVRDAILTARRWRAAALLAALLWIVVAVGVWGIGLLLGTGAVATGGVALVVTPRLWLVSLGPPVLGVLAAALAWWLERRLTGPLGRPRRRRDVESDATAWYASLPGGGRPAAGERRSLARLVFAGQAVAAVLVLVLVVTIVEAVAASVAAVLSMQRLGPKTAELISDQERITASAPLDSARAAWASILPAPDTVGDSTASAWIRDLTDAGETGASTLPAYRPRPSSVLGHASGTVLRAMQEAAAGTLPAALRDTLALFATHPRTALFRRAARAPLAATQMAALGGPFAVADAPGDARVPRTVPLFEAALANTAGAIVAVGRRDYPEAERRIGENAAFAEQLLKAPDVRANTIGFRILRSLVLEPLRTLARLGARGLDTTALRAATQHLDEAMPYTAGAAGLAVDPADMIQFTAAIQNPRVPTGYRVQWLYEGWAGLCVDPWELLTGPSAARRQALLGAAEVMSDVAHARQLAAVGESPWEVGDGSWLGAVAERSPLGVVKRIRQCAETL